MILFRSGRNIRGHVWVSGERQGRIYFTSSLILQVDENHGLGMRGKSERKRAAMVPFVIGNSNTRRHTDKLTM